jgi:hypothetical protein
MSTPDLVYTVLIAIVVVVVIVALSPGLTF